jgi:hypothetical protein
MKQIVTLLMLSLIGCAKNPLPVDFELLLADTDNERCVEVFLINQQIEQCTVVYKIEDFEGKLISSEKKTIPGNGSLWLTEKLALGDIITLESRRFSPFRFIIPKDKEQIPGWSQRVLGNKKAKPATPKVPAKKDPSKVPGISNSGLADTAVVLPEGMRHELQYHPDEYWRLQNRRNTLRKKAEELKAQGLAPRDMRDYDELEALESTLRCSLRTLLPAKMSTCWSCLNH